MKVLTKDTKNNTTIMLVDFSDLCAELGIVIKSAAYKDSDSLEIKKGDVVTITVKNPMLSAMQIKMFYVMLLKKDIDVKDLSVWMIKEDRAKLSVLPKNNVA